MSWIVRTLFICLRFTLTSGNIQKSHFEMLSTVVNPYDNNKFLTNFNDVSKATCAAVCDRDVFCLSIYYNKLERLCLINPFVIRDDEITLYQSSLGSFSYYKREIVKKPQSCHEIKETVPGAEDGHYWIYPQSPEVYGNRVKIYCHQMSGGTTPREYITLSTPNVGQIPSLRNPDCTTDTVVINGFEGTTTFNKIRLYPSVMRVDAEDYTFATWTGNRYPYGATGDCYTRQSANNRAPCGPVGTFRVVLVGTGLETKITSLWSYNGDVTFCAIEFLSDLSNFTVRCGGYCGYCALNQDGMQTMLDRTNWVDLNSATLLDFSG